MTHLVHQLELRAILAERERQAKAALRVSEAKDPGRLARRRKRGKPETSHSEPSHGLRESPANEPWPATRPQSSAGPERAPRLAPSERAPPYFPTP